MNPRLIGSGFPKIGQVELRVLGRTPEDLRIRLALLVEFLPVDLNFGYVPGVHGQCVTCLGGHLHYLHSKRLIECSLGYQSLMAKSIAASGETRFSYEGVTL